MQEPRPYQGRDGEWRASLDITAINMKMLGGRGEGGSAPQDRNASQGDDNAPMVDEEEIPF